MSNQALRIGIDFGGYTDADKAVILTLLNREFIQGIFEVIKDVNPWEVEPKYDARFILVNQGVYMSPELSPFVEIGDEYSKELWSYISQVIKSHPRHFCVPHYDS